MSFTSVSNVHNIFAEFKRILDRNWSRYKHQRQQHWLLSLDLSDLVLKHSVIFISAAETSYSIINELSIIKKDVTSENDVTLNHSRHYDHQNFNRDNNENSNAEWLKVLILFNKDLRKIL